MKLLIATRNEHKLIEIRAAFHIPFLEIVGVDSFPDMPEVVEDGETLEANARKKALECAAFSGLWSLADDTGMEVDALGGAPGVYSARYAGPDASYADNVNKMLQALQGIGQRSARFRTVMALATPGGECWTVSGDCPGRITEEVHGAGGFGYDPIFLPDGFAQTFAEMSLEDKNRISHRGLALQAAQTAWKDRLEAEALEWTAALHSQSTA